MINLDIDNFCSNCDEFEPEVSVEHKTLNLAYGFDSYHIPREEKRVNTAITCKHRTRCRSIKDYLSKADNNNG